MTAEITTRHIPAADFGPALRAARHARRLSLRQLARRINSDFGYLGALERGVRSPSTRFVALLLAELDPPADLARRIEAAGISGVGRDRWQPSPVAARQASWNTRM
ncbi:hypothetical protein GCM10009827_083800 [Dactylosporangium maewongense]|uniref:HTH cro/C1-type domain-containing protein n=1 Tax=Dactylosporangium maewongense TaxID=634393 RepID=A0ABP4MU75_9ACTN